MASVDVIDGVSPTIVDEFSAARSMENESHGNDDVGTSNASADEKIEPQTSQSVSFARAMNLRTTSTVGEDRARRVAASRETSAGHKFLPWLPSKPTLEGTLEKKSTESSWWSSMFWQNTEKWQLRHFLLYESHLFWGRGFSTMHGYGTVLSAKAAPEQGPTAFVVDIMAIPKKSMRRHMQASVDFVDLISGLCCKPAGFTTKVLRAGSEADKFRWIEALQFGTTSSPLSARMPLEFSEEIPPSPRVSFEGSESERNPFDRSNGRRRTKYPEPPPPLSPRVRRKVGDDSGSGDSGSDSFDRMENLLQQTQREQREQALGKASIGQRSVEDFVRMDADVSSQMLKAMERIPSALKQGSSLKITNPHRMSGSHDDFAGASKSVSFGEVVVTQEIEILKSPSKLGLASAEESTKEHRKRTKLLKAAGSFKIDYNQIKIGKKIGVGSFGGVYKAEWNGTLVAYKTMLDEDLKDETIEDFSEEIRMMRALRHPNIVLFYGAVIQPPRLGIVSELMARGNLEQLLHGEGQMSDSLRANGLLRRQMAADCVRGMAYLHSLPTPVVHHDLKPANLLVDANWTLKVSDFGMSRLKNYTYSTTNCNAPGGTPEWMAPEALRGDTLTELSDVYSFGVVLWELITLNYPWRELSSPVQIVAQVAFLHRRLKVPDWVDNPMDALLHECWAREVHDRPSFASIVERLVPEYPSTWSCGESVQSAAEEAAAILSSMSAIDSVYSPTASEPYFDAIDDDVVARVEDFVPQGLPRIRAPTPSSEETKRWKIPTDSSEESTEETSDENSSELVLDEFSNPTHSSNAVMAAAKEFRPMLTPLSSARW